MKDFSVPAPTWPRTPLSPLKIHVTPSDFSNFTSTLVALKLAIQEGNYERVHEIAEACQSGLGQNGPRRLSTISEEEPLFDSMILAEPSVTTTIKSKVSFIQIDRSNKSRISLPVTIHEHYESESYHEPFWITLVPHLIMTLLTLSYITGGAYMFKYFEPEVEDHPFHTCLLLSFQVCFTLDWGTLPKEAELAKVLVIPYATIGIPLTFATLSNYGRFLANGYCIYGFFSSSSKNRLSFDQQRKQIPLRVAFNMLIFHQLIGVVLFNTIFGKLGAVKSWYFIWMTVTMISLGDISPKPKTLLETILMLIYFTIGNVILQAILISICYRIQSIFLVLLKFKVLKWWHNRS